MCGAEERALPDMSSLPPRRGTTERREDVGAHKAKLLVTKMRKFVVKYVKACIN